MFWALAFVASACGAGVWSATARAIQPMSLYHDLVAGDGIAGFRDGEFYRARFRDPAGIAVLAGGTILAVSDQNNNRIRAIYLDDGNRVDTLAGTGVAGDADGPLLQASFHQPGAIVALSDTALLVNDEGSARFRLVDTQAKRVETIAGTGARGLDNGPAARALLGGIASLAYSPKENAVYFSQPDVNSVRRLDLKTRTIASVFLDDRRVQAPGALAMFQDRLCVADGGGRLLRVDQTAPGFTGERPIAEIGRGNNIRAMAESDGKLYAIQGGDGQTWFIVSAGRLWTPPAVLAESTKVPYLRFGDVEQVGLVPDPRAPRNFFVSSAVQQEILSVRDYRFGELWDKETPAGNGLVDFDYPAAKPPRTFRILVIGDSHVNYFFEPGYRTEKFPPTRIEGMPKRVELMLNTLGAIENSRTRYEVLSLTRVSWNPLLVWSAYEAPPIAKKFDVDLVLLMVPPGGSQTVEAYVERPVTERGIPARNADMEYLLKPFAERLRNSPAAPLFARAKARGWAHPIPDHEGLALDRIPILLADEGARKILVDLHTRPVAELRRGIESKFSKGSGPRVALCRYQLGSRAAAGDESDFWRSVAAGAGTDYMDLTDLFVALRESWYPLSEAGANDHFTPGGHAFFAFLLSHELLKNGWVPLQPGAAAKAPTAVTPPPAKPTEPRRIIAPPRPAAPTPS